jgi:hypothetical protein
VSDDRSSVLTYLGRPAYLLAALLVLTPFPDFINNVWPPHPSSVAWRYASEGLFSGSLLTMTLGLVLAAAVAFGRSQRAVVHLIGVVAWLGVAAAAVVALDFLLNTVQLRGSGGVDQDPAARWSYDFGALRVTAKYLVTGLLLAWIGIAARRWARGQPHHSRRDSPSPLISASGAPPSRHNSPP